MAKQLVRDPIYQQLNAALRELVSEFAPGSKFLSERQICERFDVSRATANKAISNLVVEGVLRFRKGVGTFISGDALDYDIRSLVSFTHKARSAGKRPSTLVLKLATTTAGEAGGAVCEALAVEKGESLRYIERLRLVDGEPVILERRHIVTRLCGPLTRTDLTGSLYELWVDHRHLEIAGADERIRAVNLDAKDAHRLDAAAGAAGLLVTATGYLVGGAPLWYERTLYRGDAYTFRNRTGRIRFVRPAVGAFVDASDKQAD